MGKTLWRLSEGVRRRLQARRVQRLLDRMNDEFGPAPEDMVREIGGMARPIVHGGRIPLGKDKG